MSAQSRPENILDATPHVSLKYVYVLLLPFSSSHLLLSPSSLILLRINTSWFLWFYRAGLTLSGKKVVHLSSDVVIFASGGFLSILNLVTKEERHLSMGSGNSLDCFTVLPVPQSPIAVAASLIHAAGAGIGPSHDGKNTTHPSVPSTSSLLNQAITRLEEGTTTLIYAAVHSTTTSILVFAYNPNEVHSYLISLYSPFPFGHIPVSLIILDYIPLRIWTCVRSLILFTKTMTLFVLPLSLSPFLPLSPPFSPSLPSPLSPPASMFARSNHPCPYLSVRLSWYLSMW